ncbi:hypothetical protein AB836_01380 [Rickettsiales bacterium (ex Bugula neritina AB1)]|nr:hypothetical protein AB836_01380 [Rickettsiales bacterium (ex Bugula neritina AB1)]
MNCIIKLFLLSIQIFYPQSNSMPLTCCVCDECCGCVCDHIVRYELKQQCCNYSSAICCFGVIACCNTRIFKCLGWAVFNTVIIIDFISNISVFILKMINLSNLPTINNLSPIYEICLGNTLIGKINFTVFATLVFLSKNFILFSNFFRGKDINGFLNNNCCCKDIMLKIFTCCNIDNNNHNSHRYILTTFIYFLISLFFCIGDMNLIYNMYNNTNSCNSTVVSSISLMGLTEYGSIMIFFGINSILTLIFSFLQLFFMITTRF